jgi:hypothetical protein
MAALSTPDEVERREREQHQATLADQAKQNATISTDEVADEALQAKWRPGWKARFPWLGSIAILVMLLGIAFTVTILKTSDGKKQEEWPVKYHWAREWSQQGKLKPSSALAAVNTMFNIALAIAIANGITIAWWRKAMRGATVKELHESWAFSTSSIELLTAGKAFNIIALCALTAKFALLDGIFLQQASGTAPDFFEDADLNVFRFPIVKELPPNSLGNFTIDGEGSYSRELSAALFNYYTDPTMISFQQIFDTARLDKQFDTGCSGRCNITVPGFGLSVECAALDPATYDVNPEALNGNSTDADTLVDVSFVPKFNTTDPSITMLVSYANNNDREIDPLSGLPSDQNTDCVGSLTRQTCTIRPAVINYPIVLLNTSATFSVSSGTDGIFIDQPVVMDTSTFFMMPPALESIQPLTTNSTLSLSGDSPLFPALQNILTSLFATHITQSYNSASGFSIIPSTGLEGSWWALLQSIAYFPGGCSISVVDPSQYVITEINNILFRMAVMAATDRNGSSDAYMTPFPEDVLENLVGNQTRDTIVYTSDYRWMAGAITIMALCVLCVLPVYYGFWELGRKVTLGPMEIASAFQAPVLTSEKASKAGGEVAVLLKEVGQRQVRYGEVGGQLAVAEAGATRKLPVGGLGAARA